MEWNGDHEWNKIRTTGETELHGALWNGMGTTSGIELEPQVEWNGDHKWNRMWIIGILSSLEPTFFTDL